MDEPLAADSAVRSAVHSAETRVVCSADLMDACWVVHWVASTAVKMDARWVDLTAVWKDASMAAHSAVHWAACSAALKAAM